MAANELTPLSRSDLEVYQRQTEAANARLIEVLKEVAVHFNTITNQLMLLAKSNEELLGAMLERVHHPLHQSIRDHHESVKELVTLTLGQVIKELEKNCQTCMRQIQSNDAHIRGLFDDVLSKMEYTVKENTAVIKGRLDDKEKASIKNSTLYTLIISAFIAAATLVGVIVKAPICEPPATTDKK